MTAEVMMKEYKNMKKELTVTEFQLRQFQGVSEQDMIDSILYSHQEGERVQTSTLSDKTANIAIKYKAAMERENDEWPRISPNTNTVPFSLWSKNKRAIYGTSQIAEG